ncbi:hypothetical protein SELMODRAFT_137242, partial [Selaginella moellendorffii]
GAMAWKAHAALVLVQLNYGAYHVIAKLALSVGMNQIVFCMLRDAVAIAILAPIAFVKDSEIRPPLTRKLAFSFFFLGLTGIFANQLLFMVGLKLTSPAYAAALQPATPVFTFLLSLFMGSETVKIHRYDGRAKVGGVLLSVLGALLMSGYKGPQVVPGLQGIDFQTAMGGKPSPEPLGWFTTILVEIGIDLWHIGIICLIGNCLCMSIYMVFQSLLLARYPAALSVTAYSYFFGAGMMALAALFTTREPSNWSLNSSEVFSVIYAGVVASALNYWLLTWTNKLLGPSLVALYMPLQPFATAILAHFLLGSPIYLGSVFGGGLIILGLYCVTWGRWQTEKLLLATSHKREDHFERWRGEEDLPLTESLYRLLDPKGLTQLPLSRSWGEPQ